MHIIFLSLFPSHMRDYMEKGLIEKAIKKKLITLDFIDLRPFSENGRVDDYPFGGKKGMLLKADVLYKAITSIDSYADYRILYTCPKGPVLTQETSFSLLNTKKKGLIILSGYYEGIDERIFDLVPIERISVGDVVLSSGELPAMVIADSVIRLVKGVMGNPDCITEDSFAQPLLEFEQYTQPRTIQGLDVPEVVISGHHGKISDWRRQRMLMTTLYKRPDLLSKETLTISDQKKIADCIQNEGEEQ